VPPAWLQLSVRADPSAFDAISNFLIERGSPGVVIRKHELLAYFANSPAEGSLKKDIRRFLVGIGGIYPERDLPRIRWRVLKDRNWNRSWHRFFKPQKIGKSFWVTAPWIDPPLLRRRHVITIEPGMAFGTGTHATTRGCMEFIEQAVASLHGVGFDALDVGTGSRILAVAMVKLGARKVRALDMDPVALKVARKNLRCNDAEPKVQLSGTKLNQIRKSYPLVAANLTAEVILDLAEGLTKRVAPHGFLILSGILSPKTKEVITSLAAKGFEAVRRKREREWVTLLLKRR
jgi:ribosomal protein L11 methyltransferase